jgi:hypothetical protein
MRLHGQRRGALRLGHQRRQCQFGLAFRYDGMGNVPNVTPRSTLSTASPTIRTRSAATTNMLAARSRPANVYCASRSCRPRRALRGIDRTASTKPLLSCARSPRWRCKPWRTTESFRGNVMAKRNREEEQKMLMVREPNGFRPLDGISVKAVTGHYPAGQVFHFKNARARTTAILHSARACRQAG